MHVTCLKSLRTYGPQSTHVSADQLYPLIHDICAQAYPEPVIELRVVDPTTCQVTWRQIRKDLSVIWQVLSNGGVIRIQNFIRGAVENNPTIYLMKED
jgi:hypothetical protein